MLPRAQRCGCSSTSPLEARATAQSEVPHQEAQYPMYVISIERLLAMESVEPHQVLRSRGMLVEYTPDLGSAIFVSHQWAGFHHPDPTAAQFSVLQSALRNLMNDKAKVELDVLATINGGVKKYTEKEVAALLKSYVWYDYFGVPQMPKSTSAEATADHRAEALKADPQLGRDMCAAVNSLPAYVHMSRFFLILAPPVAHTDLPSVILTQSSWGERGWCRVERAARAFAATDTRMLLVTSDAVVQMVHPADYLFDFPGSGKFSAEKDRADVGDIMRGMVETKLGTLLAARQFADYRFLFALRRVVFAGHAGRRGSLHLVQTDDRLPPAERFLTELGLRGARERDGAGRTALHYAAIAGDADVVGGLLEMRADVDVRTTKADKPHSILSAGFTPLHLAAYFSTRVDVLTVLLDARARVDARDGIGNTPLHYSAISGRAATAQLLFEHGAALESRNGKGLTPLLLAAMFGRVELARALLALGASATATIVWELNALHYVAIFSGTVGLVEVLVDAGCPVDGQMISGLAGARRVENRAVRLAMTLVFGGAGLAHRCGSRTAKVVLMSHIEGMTPLMFAAALGRRDVARALLSHGASTALTARNGSAAADWARLFGQPEDYVEELR